MFSRSAMTCSLKSHELQPARLLCPWGSPENTGVGCHFLLQDGYRILIFSCLWGWEVYSVFNRATSMQNKSQDVSLHIKKQYNTFLLLINVQREGFVEILLWIAFLIKASFCLFSWRIFFNIPAKTDYFIPQCYQ